LETTASQRSLVHVVLVKLDFRLGFLGLFILLLGVLAKVEVHRTDTGKSFAYKRSVRYLMQLRDCSYTYHSQPMSLWGRAYGKPTRAPCSQTCCSVLLVREFRSYCRCFSKDGQCRSETCLRNTNEAIDRKAAWNANALGGVYCASDEPKPPRLSKLEL
jgi:hypothetical protein